MINFKKEAVVIRRPVLVLVINFLILLAGGIGFFFLGVREYPNVDPPIVNVTTNYAGANADVIESQITEPLEESINGIDGIALITSVSREQRSTITVEFELGTDIEQAANDVRDRVSRARGNLPADADPPIVSKADANANPIIFLSIRSDKRSLLELSRFANDVFKERFQTIKGVSEVRIWGEKKYAMRLWMEAPRLAAYGLTPEDVAAALARENVELPSGRIEGNSTELTVRTQGRLTDPAAFENMPIKEANGFIVRFKDIGRVELGAENLRTVLKRDGIPMVGTAIIPQPGANAIEISKELYKRLENIKKDLPPDIETKIGFDTTKFIQLAINEVIESLIIALGLVTLIIFLFLRDWRTTLIPVVAIPISLVGAFFIMYLADFSINVLTLLALVLGIGIVVDDAIVVLENIYAKIEAGVEPRAAGSIGTQEIAFAVIATTVALVVVFLPVLFLQGLVGRLFREFGIVLSAAVIISSIVALTLTPMLSSRLLKRTEKQNWFYRVTEKFYVGLNERYASSLQGFFRYRWLVFPIFLLTGGLIYIFLKALPSELAPTEDRSAMVVTTNAPEGTTFDYMEQFMNELVAATAEAVPETDVLVSVTSPGFGASSSVNSGFMRVLLVDPAQRTRSQAQIADSLTKLVNRFTGGRTFVSQEQSIRSQFGSLPVQYVIQAPNFEKLKEVLPKFLEEARANPTFTFVEENLKFNKPELNIEIDRIKAKELGVSVVDIARTLQLAYSGQRYGYFVMNGKQYQVIGQMERTNRNKPIDIQALYVRSSAGKLIQLDNLVKMMEAISPPQIYRFNRYVSATVSAGLAPGQTLGQGIAEMEKIADKVLDDRFSTALAGTSRDYQESASALQYAFILALILIYLVLAAQFESFRAPFVILLTVPLALFGALLSLWYFQQTLNIFSQIGIIMLIGLVTKNGILIVEFANQRLEEGLTVRSAILDAAASRFRPILMTSISTILGFLPIALALGAGSESRVSMGIAVVGGITVSTFLTLYVIPAIYAYVMRDAKVNATDANGEPLELAPNNLTT